MGVYFMDVYFMDVYFMDVYFMDVYLMACISWTCTSWRVPHGFNNGDDVSMCLRSNCLRSGRDGVPTFRLRDPRASPDGCLAGIVK
jgi:hypothetical protein